MNRRFDDLNDAEVLALDHDGVGRWIDIECACEGVPLLPPEPTEPAAPLMTPDVTVFNVGNLYFANADEATRIAELAMSFPRHELNYVSGPRYEKRVGPASDVLVSPQRAYSVKHWEEVKDEAERYTTAKATYDHLKTDFDKAVKLRERIAESVREHVERVQDAERERQQMRLNLARYLDLADGDREIAVKFLKAAYPDAATVLPELAEPAVEVAL